MHNNVCSAMFGYGDKLFTGLSHKKNQKKKSKFYIQNIVSGQLPTRTIPHHRTGIGPDEWFYSVVVALWELSGWGIILGIVVPLGNGWALFCLVGNCPCWGVVLKLQNIHKKSEAMTSSSHLFAYIHIENYENSKFHIFLILYTIYIKYSLFCYSF